MTDKAVAATCTADGKTEGSHCSVCGKVLKAQTVVKAAGHQWDAGKVTKKATCEEKGVKTFTCAVCKETKTEAIAAKGHTAVTDKAVAATCTADGKTAGSHCSVCGKVLKARTVVKAAGHQWDAGKVTKPATAEAEGERTYTCSVCKATKTEPIEKLKPAAPEYTPGDVDGDGTITPADARLALRASVGLEPDIAEGTAAYLASDADGDGAITPGDARLILRASVGLEDASKFGKR